MYSNFASVVYPTHRCILLKALLQELLTRNDLYGLVDSSGTYAVRSISRAVTVRMLFGILLDGGIAEQDHTWMTDVLVHNSTVQYTSEVMLSVFECVPYPNLVSSSTLA